MSSWADAKRARPIARGITRDFAVRSIFSIKTKTFYPERTLIWRKKLHGLKIRLIGQKWASLMPRNRQRSTWIGFFLQTTMSSRSLRLSTVARWRSSRIARQRNCNTRSRTWQICTSEKLNIWQREKMNKRGASWNLRLTFAISRRATRSSYLNSVSFKRQVMSSLVS